MCKIYTPLTDEPLEEWEPDDEEDEDWEIEEEEEEDITHGHIQRNCH